MNHLYKGVKIKLHNELATMPKKSHKTDACYDVVATSKEDLGDGRIKYGLGFSAEIPFGTRLDLRSRSSIHKTGLILSNSIGTGDEGFTGEYQAIFYHVIQTLPPYEVGDRILQIHVEPRFDVEFSQVQELADTERGANGIGSTGLK